MNIRKLLVIVILLSLGLSGSFLTTSFAQETPTDRPFPVAATRVPASPAQATERPFPGVARATTQTQPTAAAVAATSETTAEATSETTAELTTGDALATAAAAQATADQLLTENKSLQDQLASAQTDKGATLYAIVIVVIGALLAFGVFFGLRRGGK